MWLTYEVGLSIVKAPSFFNKVYYRDFYWEMKAIDGSPVVFYDRPLEGDRFEVEPTGRRLLSIE